MGEEEVSVVRMDPGILPPRKGKWVVRLRPLMDEPEVWFMVYSSNDQKRGETQASNLRSGRVKTPPGKWEFISRWNATTRVSRTFARYIGPQDPVAAVDEP